MIINAYGKKGLVVIFILLVLVGCGTGDQSSKVISVVASVQASTANAPTSSSSAIRSGQAGSYAGEYLSVRINRAYCSYQPSIEGSPTFCNDAPYPNHDFTLLVWESDWSSLDGACLIVTGLVTIFQGKAEIVVSSTSQVAYC